MKLADRLNYIRDSLYKAAEKSGQNPEAVTLVGVTKSVPVDLIAEAVRSGLSDIGENRVQEALKKREELISILPPEYPGPRWHLVGHLQRNKTKHAVRLFDLIHSVDSFPLAEEIDRRAEGAGRVLDILLEVNASGEASKQGCGPGEVEELAQEISRLTHVVVRGLMTMAPLAKDPESSRPVFSKVKTLYNRLAVHRFPRVKMEILSMGMSQDYTVAVEEGANLVRIGRALFGERHVR
ncbi:MAG: YggS family pyridoxal phosphate-dependent enzyme [Candidatus Omnitrophica bacterium]|nr:YggS family pyridoxal phosphate-dependent enzyme [Candidatus Omnitrophota bacterium]